MSQCQAWLRFDYVAFHFIFELAVLRTRRVSYTSFLYRIPFYWHNFQWCGMKNSFEKLDGLFAKYFRVFFLQCCLHPSASFSMLIVLWLLTSITLLTNKKGLQWSQTRNAFLKYEINNLKCVDKSNRYLYFKVHIFHTFLIFHLNLFYNHNEYCHYNQYFICLPSFFFFEPGSMAWYLKIKMAA